MKTFTKTPAEELDYGVDWSKQLAKDDDTIAQSAWTIDAGLTVGIQQNSDTIAKFWGSAGTVGDRYSATNKIITAGGRTFERTIYIEIVEKKAA